jgi:hypothetical protein
MKKAADMLAGFHRSRADHCFGWWSDVGSFGEDFFGDDD